MPSSSDSPKGKAGFLKKILKRSSSDSNKSSDSNRSSILTKVDSGNGSNGKSQYPHNISRSSSSKIKLHPAKTYFDEDSSLYEEDNTGEDYIDEVSLSSSTNSQDLDNFDHLQFNEKVQFPTISNIQYNFDESDFNPPWFDLTYESLIFPNYIKTSRKNKVSPKLNHLFLAQELSHDNSSSLNQKNILEEDFDDKLSEIQSIFSDDNNNTCNPNSKNIETSNPGEILVMEFNKDGTYMASAGRDGTIKIWKVISSPLARLQSTSQTTSEHTTQKRGRKARKKNYNSAPVFHRSPARIFKSHTGNVISLDWSKNNFLITGSMDRTAKLWHVDRDDCLHTFQLEDFVTAVKFHPTDDRFFVSGSLDNRVLLWSVLENNIAYEKDLGDEVLITAITFTPDGKSIIVGGFNGSIFVLETKGLHVIDRIEVKNNSLGNKIFHNKNDNKITGIQCFEDPENNEPSDKPIGNWCFLITTNDSKIRLGNSAKRKVITRFKGLTNNSSSIVASTDTDHRYIISGSEDHRCYIWENNNSIVNNKLRQSVKGLVLDGRHHLAEAQKHKKLGKLFPNDNKYLKKILDTDDPNKSSYKMNENNSYTSFHANHSRVNVAIFAPENTMSLLGISDDIIYDLVKRGASCSFEKKQPSNSLDGQIIVTADQCGNIRVFREDSAYFYRRKFLQMYKRGNQKGCHADLSPTATVNGNFESPEGLEIPTINRRFSGKGLSPTTESFPLKKLHNRLRGNSNADQNQENYTSSPSNSMTQSTASNCKISRVSRNTLFGGFDAQNLGNHRSSSPPLFKYRSADAALNGSTPASTLQSIEDRFRQPKPGLSTPGKSTSSIPLLVNTDVDGNGSEDVIEFKTPIATLPTQNFLPISNNDG